MARKSDRIVRLTKALADRLEPPKEGTTDHRRGYTIYWDEDLIGFGLRVTNQSERTYFVHGRIHGKMRQSKIGRAQILTAERARDIARSWLARICEGGDPVSEKRQKDLSGVTLRQAIETYCNSGRLRESTQELVRSRLAKAFPDWLPNPLASITEDRCERRYLEVAKDRPGDALVCFRYFRAVWNHARDRVTDTRGNPLLPECPTRRLKNLWKGKDTRRQRIIQSYRLRDWRAAVDALPDPAARAFFLFLIYTGCRRSEAAALRWSDVDLEGGAVTFGTTKTSSYAIPLPTQLVAILRDLRACRVGDYPFGDALGRARKARSAFTHEIDQLRESFGDFGPHDLRRGFITTAETCGVPTLSVKRLVNHSTRNDVTGGYFAADVAALRPHMQRIGDTLEAAMIADGNVTQFRRTESA